MPPPVAPASAGRPEDLSGAKVKISEGFVAKSLSIEIVRVVFALLSDSAWAFLQECQHARGLPTAGCLRAWAEIGLSFSWKIEIAFYFNSELNFGN